MKKRKIITVAIISILLLGFVKIDNFDMVGSQKSNSKKMVYAEELSGNKDLDLTCNNALLMNLESGQVLVDVNSQDKIYPASLTKIMTTVAILENLEDPKVKLRVEEDVLNYAHEQGASTAGFKAGELVKAKDLIYATMLLSGADSSLTLANYLEGSEEGLVIKMNKLAEKIGMDRTHFTNVTGLHDDNHYTTAEDMAKLFQYSLENEDFRNIVKTKYYIISGTNEHLLGRPIKSRFYGVSSKNTDRDIRLLGGKTGYTSRAGLCLATWGEYDGEEYISITLGSDGDLTTEPNHLLDTIKLYKEIKK